MKQLRKYLHGLYGNLDDCRYAIHHPETGVEAFDGWTDGELEQFRNDPKHPYVLRDLHLGHPRRLYRNHFRLTHPRLASDVPIEIVAPTSAERILLLHKFTPEAWKSFQRLWPWPMYRESDRTYSVLFVKYVRRERLCVILDQFQAAVTERLGAYELLGRPTRWQPETDGKYRLVRRGDPVPVPRTAEACDSLRALPEVNPEDLQQLVQRWRNEDERGEDPMIPHGVDDRVVSFVVPKDFDPSLMPMELRPHADYARFLLSTIRTKWTQWDTDDEGFASLHSKVLEQVIPKRVLYPMKRWLSAAGLVVCDHAYSAGLFCKSYRIADEWDTKKWHLVPCDNPLLNEKLRSWRKLDLPVYKHLVQNLSRVRIPDEADEVVGQIDDENLRMGLPLQFTRNHEVVLLVREGCWQQTVCRQGRFHSVFTRMDKRLRDLLLLDGQSVVWTDVTNAQPLIFGLLLKDFATYGSLVGMDAFRRRSISGNREEGEGATGPAGIMFPKGKTAAVLKPDVHDYIATCEKGQIYERLMDATATSLNRDDFKQQVFQEVFYRQIDYPSEIVEVFNFLFPTAAKMIQYVRSFDSKKPTGLLSRMMQKYESDLLIRNVCGRLMTELPEAAIITVHDSLGTTSEHIERVEAVIRDEFGKFGIVPRLKRYPGGA